MCEFISWVEKDDKVIFLTGEDVFHTKHGKELQKYCKSTEDLTGHGAIRHYYNFKGGTDKECTDFSTPENFPSEIAKAIKQGKMRGLGVAEQLLTKPALAEYEKVQQPAWVEYKKVEQAALAEYKKVQQPAWVEYEKVEQPAWVEYEKVQQPAWAEYEKVQQPAWAEYKKVQLVKFWDLFAISENRNPLWREQ